MSDQKQKVQDYYNNKAAKRKDDMVKKAKASQYSDVPF